MLDFLRDKDAEVAALLERVVGASAEFVKRGGRPPRDIIGIPNVERLVHALRAPEMGLELFMQASQMAVFEGTLFRHEPYVAALEEAGLLPEGFGKEVLARVHELRAKKEKTLGMKCLPDPPCLLSLDGRPPPEPAAPALSQEWKDLACAMHQIIDADIFFLQSKGLWQGVDHIGLAATRRLKRALEDPGADRLFLDFCLVHFETTMMDHENDVGGLEDLHLLPEGFGKTTLERVHRLRGEVMPSRVA